MLGRTGILTNCVGVYKTRHLGNYLNGVTDSGHCKPITSGTVNWRSLSNAWLKIFAITPLGTR